MWPILSSCKWPPWMTCHSNVIFLSVVTQKCYNYVLIALTVVSDNSSRYPLTNLSKRPGESIMNAVIPANTVHVQAGHLFTRAVRFTWWWFTAASLVRLSLLSVQNKMQVVNGALTISSLTLSDAGMYQCVAENRHGRVFTNAELRVVGKKASFLKCLTILHTPSVRDISMGRESSQSVNTKWELVQKMGIWPIPIPLYPLMGVVRIMWLWREATLFLQ